MSIGRYLLRRALVALLLVFVVSSGTLLLTRLAPGDSATDAGLASDPAQRARLRGELGLDRPLGAQYLDWLAGALRFDLGWSVVFSRPVADLLSERALNTAVLASVALVGATAVGVPLGLYTGAHASGFGPGLVRTLSVVILSVPPLLGSLFFMLFAARTGWLPVGGMTSSVLADSGWMTWAIDLARHIPLPALALALPLAATLEQLQSQAIRESLREPFVRAAQARGLTFSQALRHHAWRVSLAPVLGLYGLMIGSLFSGSFAVEVVTGWPGLGRLMFDALRARDLYLVTGCAAAGACFIALGTLTADVMLVAADPRRRMGDLR
ncbi:MAG TPA: ABC transporter permease [Vicinamibacterales bacterium]|nr:ABC transporter permease [Vicinamibacterales bacterium]